MPPRGSSWSKDKYDRCVRQVKRRGRAANAYAVCSAQAKRSGRRTYRNPVPPGVVEVFDEEYQEVRLVWFDPSREHLYELYVDPERGKLDFLHGDAIEIGRSAWRINDPKAAHGTFDSDQSIAVGDAGLRRIGLDGRLMLQEMLARVFEIYSDRI